MNDIHSRTLERILLRFKIFNLIAILFGSAVMAFGINSFNLANGLAEGGITGVALLLNYVLGWDPGLSSLLINLPLLLLGWKVMGRTGFLYALIGAISFSVFLFAFQSASMPLPDPLLASLYAGAFVGLGLGIVFRYGGITDGVDVIARLFQKSFGWSFGRTIFLTDGLVLAASLFYLDLQRAMYTMIAIVIGSRLIDFVQEGSFTAKAVTIISKKPEEIASKILKEMKRGVTFLSGKGAYTQEPQEVLYCVISKRETGRLKQIVMETDPHAFVIFNDVHEVVGRGWESKNPTA
jgi:uncharacterized membrane-anchored protein YitT (DUF2179 family)